MIENVGHTWVVCKSRRDEMLVEKSRNEKKRTSPIGTAYFKRKIVAL